MHWLETDYTELCPKTTAGHSNCAYWGVFKFEMQRPQFFFYLRNILKQPTMEAAGF